MVPRFLPMPVLLLSLLLASPLLQDSSAQEYPELGIKVQTVAGGLSIPWSIDWLPDGTVLFTERDGGLREIRDGTVSEVLPIEKSSSAEGGTLGVAVDPDFGQNGYIYLYYTYDELFSHKNKVVRYVYSDGAVTEDAIIIDGIPGGGVHNGGRIAFGPDGMLYVSTGDAGNAGLSRDPDSLAGKILRVASDGSIPEDNPFGQSPVWSLGHRNPQGMDWDSRQNMLATEHGPSGEMGFAHDEINLIVPGADYGWPDAVGDESLEGTVQPILHTGGETWAPSGSEFYYGGAIPLLDGSYLVASLRGSHLGVITFSEDWAATSQSLFQGDFGRLRDVQTGPDGLVYLLTSNRDGRGFPAQDDDRILRIAPLAAEGEPECALTSEERLVYAGEGGPLDVAVRHAGYNVSPIRLNIDSKSASFDFGRAGTADAAVCAAMEIMVQRPLISPPYAVTIKSDGAEVIQNVMASLSEDGYYSHLLDLGDADAGTVTLTGTYAVPEFGIAVYAVLAAGAAMAILAARRMSLGIRGHLS